MQDSFLCSTPSLKADKNVLFVAPFLTDGKVDAVTFGTGTGGTLSGLYICTVIQTSCFFFK